MVSSLALLCFEIHPSPFQEFQMVRQLYFKSVHPFPDNFMGFQESLYLDVFDIQMYLVLHVLSKWPQFYSTSLLQNRKKHKYICYPLRYTYVWSLFSLKNPFVMQMQMQIFTCLAPHQHCWFSSALGVNWSPSVKWSPQSTGLHPSTGLPKSTGPLQSTGPPSQLVLSSQLGS